MHTDHPFARPTSPDKAELLAYLEGRLSPERAHAVERSMEEDPFLREAMEGLSAPGATSALAGLDHQGPSAERSGGKHTWFFIGAVAGAAIMAVTWLALPQQEMGEAHSLAGTELPPREALPDQLHHDAIRMDPAEVSTAVEQPEKLRIGHRAAERPQPKEIVVRELGPAPLDPLRPELTANAPNSAKPGRAARSSRMLLFPHDLKLVHPEELYPYEPGVLTGMHGVPAAYPDRRTEQSSSEKQRSMAYTVYMDMALGQFSDADHRACLKSLNFLLEQYPNDVNALFYAGLCSHNLGLYERARQFLHRAATHQVDSFYEEATWYHALTLERLGEQEAAQEAFARIAAEHGFYAARAAERIR